ncbi:MAG: hypothetical protein GY795_04190 [Desulfobacterales bacterium]|nr:hypothetical protein [Desulfobacterales bacterium]
MYRKNVKYWLLTVFCRLLIAVYWLQVGAVYAQQKDAKIIAPELLENKNAAKGMPPGALTPDSTDAKGGENVIEMSDIHDIKPPEKIGINLVPLYYALLAVLILALIAVAIFYLKKRKKKIKKKKIITLSPEEQAMNMLDGLLDVDSIEGKEFYFRLSAILRTYIQGRYSIDAPEMTTEEFLPRVDELKIDRELQQQLKELFRATDPVKFAGARAVQTRMQNDLNFVISFVKKTTEKEVRSEK